MIASAREKNVTNCILAVKALEVCHIYSQSLSKENHTVMLDWNGSVIKVHTLSVNRGFKNIKN